MLTLQKLWILCVALAVSLIAMLLLLPLAARRLHSPVVVANFVIIVLCSIANFAASDLWTFAARAPTAKQQAPPVILERLPPTCRGPLRGVHGQSD
ncbi:MAG: hypothetical protein P4M01_04330 [Acidobacteriota bacterium]|nr:hypothetical protein [Acidobacteriota bacterium]